jgi:hypothetical protein
MQPSSRIVALACHVSAVIVFGALPTALDARITKITIDSTTAVAGGASFGTVGAYEELRGTAFGAIDPNDRRNNVITDIQLAPRNAEGRVEYKTQFSIIKPVNMDHASGVMLYVVPNRGNRATPFNIGDDGFLYTRGQVVLNSAWQGDIPISVVSGNQLGIDVPIARSADGTSVTGPAWDRFVAVAQTSNANTTTQELSGRGRTPASLDTSLATLISATSETREGVKSGVVQIASSDWAFADCRSVPFPGTADATRICLKNGFDPALLYELVFTAKDPYVLGVGAAAMRDIVSFFRHAQADDASTANPLAGRITNVIGFGNSQSGRFQKHFLNNGFNEDETGKIVWDGMNPNIAGMMGSFNIRFAQPGDIAELYDPGADGPLWWAPYEDTVRGRPLWGLLSRCTMSGTCPKIFETYGGPEYWYSRGTVGIAGTTGTEDLPVPANVRRYYHSGTTHGGGGGGFNLGTASTNPNTLASNPNPQRETNRALYAALVDWVVNGTSPPPSAYPRITDGTLVPATSAAMGWPDIPGAPKPDGVMNPVLDYDYGSTFRYNDGSGVISNVAPAIKQVIPTLAPAVDADGNEIAGLKSLLHRLPLGTYTGWNPIGSGPLKGREASLAAGYIPFAKTIAERLASGDPRPSIEERYPNLIGYYFQALTEVQDLVQQRLLLPEDANRLVNQVLNDMLKSGLLPKREFIRHFAKRGAGGDTDEADTGVLEIEEAAR